MTSTAGHERRRHFLTLVFYFIMCVCDPLGDVDFTIVLHSLHIASNWVFIVPDLNVLMCDNCDIVGTSQEKLLSLLSSYCVKLCLTR